MTGYREWIVRVNADAGTSLLDNAGLLFYLPEFILSFILVFIQPYTLGFTVIFSGLNLK